MRSNKYFFMHDPKTLHMSTLKRIIRYIQGTLEFGLHIYPTSLIKLISYTDADWGGWPDTRQSTSGYCVYLEDNLISWYTKRQPTFLGLVSRPNILEYYNIAYESGWIRNLLLELHCPVTKANDFRLITGKNQRVTYSWRIPNYFLIRNCRFSLPNQV